MSFNEQEVWRFVKNKRIEKNQVKTFRILRKHIQTITYKIILVYLFCLKIWDLSVRLKENKYFCVCLSVKFLSKKFLMRFV